MTENFLFFFFGVVMLLVATTTTTTTTTIFIYEMKRSKLRFCNGTNRVYNDMHSAEFKQNQTTVNYPPTAKSSNDQIKY